MIWQIPGWEAPSDIDAPCIPLCQAINEHLDGVLTVESCCGHGTQPFSIWVMVRSLRALAWLCYWIDQCHSGESGWQVVAYSDCSGKSGFVRIEGPSGEKAYDASSRIAAIIAAEAS